MKKKIENPWKLTAYNAHFKFSFFLHKFKTSSHKFKSLKYFKKIRNRGNSTIHSGERHP